MITPITSLIKKANKNLIMKKSRDIAKFDLEFVKVLRYYTCQMTFVDVQS